MWETQKSVGDLFEVVRVEGEGRHRREDHEGWK